MSAETIACPECSRPVPRGRLACPSCGALLASLSSGARRWTAGAMTAEASSGDAPAQPGEAAEAAGAVVAEAVAVEPAADEPAADEPMPRAAEPVAYEPAPGERDEPSAAEPAAAEPAATEPPADEPVAYEGVAVEPGPAEPDEPGATGPDAHEEVPAEDITGDAVVDEAPVDHVAPGEDPPSGSFAASPTEFPAASSAAEPSDAAEQSTAWPPRDYPAAEEPSEPATAWPRDVEADALRISPAEPVQAEPDTGPPATAAAPATPAEPAWPGDPGLPQWAKRSPSAGSTPPPAARTLEDTDRVVLPGPDAATQTAAPAQPAAAPMPPSAVFPDATTPPGGAAARSPSRMRPGDAPFLADLPLRAPASFPAWLVAGGFGLAVLGLLMPWSAEGIGAGTTRTYFDSWGLAPAGHGLILLVVLIGLGLAFVPSKVPAWLRDRALAPIAAGLVTGIAWPYLVGGLDRQIGVVVAVSGAILLGAGSILAELATRNGSRSPSV